MGYGTYSTERRAVYTNSIASKSTNDVFHNNQTHRISAAMSPHGLKIRECLDSTDHPESLAVMIFLDVTGSMGAIPESIVRNHLDTMMANFIDHGLPDVSVLFGTIGDHISNRYPVQVGQFESDDQKLTMWLTESYLEGGGGGTMQESYLLAWLIGARHTSIDCYEKRKKKGFIFTVGDEMCWDNIDASYLEHHLGYIQPSNLTAKELLEEAKQKFHVFHIHVNEGQYPDNTDVINYWTNLLGMPPIILRDYHQIAEIISTTVLSTTLATK